MGTWINTGLYKQVWKAIAKSGEYAGFDWTIRVHVDAVFSVDKLTKCIAPIANSPSGAFLQNCEGAKYDFFCNLQVSSESYLQLLAYATSANFQMLEKIE